MSSLAIDRPDFDEALQSSRDGHFQRAVLEYLDTAAADLRQQMQRGLSPLDFAEAQKVATAIHKAGDVMRFSLRSA